MLQLKTAHTRVLYSCITQLHLAALFVCVQTLSPNDSLAAQVYWTDSISNQVSRTSIDIPNTQAVVAGTRTGTRGIAVDGAEGLLFWGDERGNSLNRATLDGQQQQLVRSVPALDIAIDTAERKVYWNERVPGRILKSNYDGSEVETLMEDIPGVRGISLDLVGRKVYWAVPSAGIMRSDLDGRNVESVITSGIDFLETTTVSPHTNTLFWVDSGLGEIGAADLNGDNQRVIATASSGIRGIAHDAVSGKVYWTDVNTRSISRANSDGTDVEVFLSGLGSPRRLAILQDLLGDFNDDYLRTTLDIDLLSIAVLESVIDTAFDLNGDGEVDEIDRSFWVEDLVGTSFGDANLNGEVDFADFLSLSVGFDQSGGWEDGDFDGSGKVAFNDFLLLAQNFGESKAVAATVPEPRAAVWYFVMCLFVTLQRRRAR